MSDLSADGASVIWNLGSVEFSKRKFWGGEITATLVLNIILLCSSMVGTFAAPVKMGGSCEIETLLVQARQQSRAGDSAKAAQTYIRAKRISENCGDQHGAAKALLGLGACQLRLFSYKAALQSLSKARGAAFASGDKLIAAKATIDLSSLYFQLGDLLAAENFGKEAVTFLESSADRDLFARALIDYGSIELELGRSFEEGRRDILRAVSIAVERKDTELQCIAWEYLGESSLNAEKLLDARPALEHAYELGMQLPHGDGLAFTLINQADLDYRLHNFPAALDKLNRALTLPRSDLLTLPEYEPIYLRGRILVSLGRRNEGLSKLSDAVRLAREWRRYALPGDMTSTRTAVRVHKVFEDYSALAAEIALQRHDDLLARQALAVISENRAASLREQLALAFHHQHQFPDRYYELISELQKEQAHATFEKTSGDIAKVATIRLELSTIENEVGFHSGDSTSQQLQDTVRNPVAKIQESLDDNTLLLSFSIRENKSYVWAMTRNGLALRELAGAADINSMVNRFCKGVRSQNDPSGEELSETILGKLDSSAYGKSSWLIVADGALLDGVPFAALPSPKASGKRGPLCLHYTIRFLPSERLLLSHWPAASNRRFIGVGDPIYNSADPRLVRPNHSANPYRGPILLGRLLGSSHEIRAAAEASGLPDVEILIGKHATREVLAKILLQPAQVIHFAVHIVSPTERRGEAALALSMTSQNIPELLTPEAIAQYRVPGSLVVLSGCFSQQGQILPSAGVLGLGRSWLLAGASAVVVSSWAMPDDSGAFFQSFYEHFKTSRLTSRSVSEAAALALRRAQIDIMHGNGYQSLPSFWAAYSVLARE